jgi:alkanesulfonate monooxygenase
MDAPSALPGPSTTPGMTEALDAQLRYARKAEACGVDSLMVNFGMSRPDPILLSAALGIRTSSVRFLITCRTGIVAPTMFVQQVNTLTNLIGDRVTLNMVSGHSPEEQRAYGDFLPHDDRYARADEFLAICNALWDEAGPVDFRGRHYTVEGATALPAMRPRVYIGGNSPQARDLALSRGTHWMLMIEPLATLHERIAPHLDAGINIGVRMSVVVRETREEALDAARAIVAEAKPKGAPKSDSETFRTRYEAAADEWLAPMLWNGAVRTHGPAAVALVGTPDDVAGAIAEYAELGVTEFLLSDWPKRDEMEQFQKEVVPLLEAARSTTCN